MKYIIFGCEGQSGRTFMDLLGDRAVGFSHSDCDIRHRQRVLDIVSQFAIRHSPFAILNCAAFNSTAACQYDPPTAYDVNTWAVDHLVEAAKENDAILMHFSSDYVFDGQKGTPYTEDDQPNPQQVYGLSKWGGENLVRYQHEKHYVVRTSGLFGRLGSNLKGGSFVDRIIARAREERHLMVVRDLVFSPTYVPDLARRCLELIEQGAPFGTYHVTNSGRASWYDLACAAIDLAGLGFDVPIIAIDRQSVQMAEHFKRPPFSVLDNAASRAAGFPPLRSWQAALEEYL